MARLGESSSQRMPLAIERAGDEGLTNAGAESGNPRINIALTGSRRRGALARIRERKTPRRSRRERGVATYGTYALPLLR